MIFEPRTGVTIGDRFVLEELAGSGGMGEVYRARDERTGERVAVKLLHAGADAHVQRFLREARLLARLEHPGIVRYIAHGEEPSLFLAMEWLEGEDLGARLARSPLELRQCLELARRVAEALDAAHRRGVIHRDIKPSNIFLCDGRIDRVKLLDFGIARLVEGTRAVTMSGQVVGTVGYMAPEQAREARDVGAKVDVFSLGCVLFECLTARPAFPGDRLMAVLAKILFADTPRVSDLREGVPPALDELVARMMRKMPAERPTLPSLIAALDAIAGVPNLTELRPRATGPRSQAEEPAISDQEQRVMSVVLISDEADSAVGHASPTLSIQQINDAARELSQAVEPYGGRLEMLAGGSRLVVLAGSGAASDRAGQAARCSLALRRMLPSARMAVAMGRGDPTAEAQIGEVVARAAKLLDLTQVHVPGGDARQGGIRIDHTVAGLLDNRFEVSGDAHGLELIAERRGADPVRKLLGKPAPFVGRDRELAIVMAALEECFHEPVASAAIITAPVGAGKSRLLHEVLQRLASEEPSVAVWMARGDPMAPGSSFAMLAQLVHGIAGLSDGEISEVWRHKLSARVARHVPAAEVPRVAEFLGELVGAQFPDEGRAALRAARSDAALMGDQMLRAWQDFVAAECEVQPVVVVLEDLHWGDLPSVRFLDHTLRMLRSSPLMVLALGRPELTETFPDLFSERRVQPLRLPELTPRAAKKLVSDVLGSRVDAATTSRLVERAAGNAFYLEELIRAVAERGGEALPDTVLAMAQARLERLSADARRILRAGSVFGQVFWVGGVAALVDDRPENVAALLDELVHREFVVRHPSSRFRGEDELGFRHVLVRDAAYAMLTDRDKVMGHKQAAAWLEAAGERDAMVMAEHLERGGEPHGAVVWYLWAAEQAFEGNDLEAVIARAERGIACGARGAVLGELRLLQAEAIGWGAHSEDHSRLARKALLLSPRGSGAYARAAAELAVASCRLGDQEQLELAATSLQESDGAATMSVAHVLAIARTVGELLVAGRPELATPLVKLIEETAPSFEEDQPILDAIRGWLRAACALYAGNPERHAREGDALVAALEEHGQLRYAVVVNLHMVLALAALGADDQAVARAEAVVERATTMGLTSYADSATAHMALPLARLGRLDEAQAAARRSLAAALAGKDRVTEARARASLAAILLLSGDLEAAQREARDVLAKELFPAEARAEAAGVLARSLLAQCEQPAQTEGQARAALAQATLPSEARVGAASSLARALLTRGQAFEAAMVAGQGIELARSGSVSGDAALRWVRIQALEAAGADDEARRSLGETAQLLRARAEAMRDERWRERFLAIPEHRAILERAV